MASIDYSKVPITEKPLYVPPLEEVVDVLSRGLADTFESVSVSAVESPDLTQPPYHLTSPGLTGESRLIELGGPPYLVPLVQRDKIYDLKELAQHLRRDPALLAGAGAGPWPYLGVNCEGIINMSVRNGTVSQGTRIVSVTPRGAAKGTSSYLQETLPPTETRTALLGNYLLSEGKPGKVIKVVVMKRTGSANFITAIRETLKNQYGDHVVGLGGTFLLRAGRGKYHVMPDFSSAALCSDSDVDGWLHYFELRAPIVHAGTLVTGDLDLDLRVQHFHGFSLHGDGGHYHYDTTPETVEYEGYFTLAAGVVWAARSCARWQRHISRNAVGTYTTPLATDAAVNSWLRFFEFDAPLVHVGTLVTGDIGLNLRLQHFHGYTTCGTQGGHYDNDRTPGAVGYEGYFTFAGGGVVRIDPPPAQPSSLGWD